jgi:hypothetical protein
MKHTRWRRAFIAISLSSAAFGSARAQTVQTFESFASCNTSFSLANQNNLATFAGLAFNNQWTCYSYPESTYPARSGTNRVYTGLQTAAFSFTGGPVQFLGAWFAGATRSTPITLKMYLGLNLVGTSGSLSATTTQTFLSSGYSGAVDKVEVQGPAGFYVMDDITYQALPSSTVPEPASMALVAVGLLGLGAVARRRRTVG